MKVDISTLFIDLYKGVSTWRIRGFYIQCLKELTFAKSKSTGNNCPHTTIASSSPTRYITGHINNQYKVYFVNILYLIFNI